MDFAYSYLIKPAVEILVENDYKTESSEIFTVLEDVNSPITRNFHQKLYDSILNKAHIDFGDIPKSRGNIKNYSGYHTMMDTLNTMRELAEEHKAGNVVEYVKIVEDAIKHIEGLSSTYQRGFETKTEYVSLEYDTYVYFCVEATTALIYSFVEVIKTPEKQVMDLALKNTKLRADEFYFEHLKKFNNVQDKMGISYRKMLDSMINKGGDNFIGTAEIVGVATVAVVLLSIIPITREVIYQIYNFRGKLSDSLEMQATFLEMNQTRLEHNSMMTADKKKKVMERQSQLAKKLRSLSNVLQVKSSKSILDTKRELEKDNKMLSINNIRDDVSNSPLEIL